MTSFADKQQHYINLRRIWNMPALSVARLVVNYVAVKKKYSKQIWVSSRKLIMCLQLFQLTCKCGHLHLRRKKKKRKEEIEGGTEREKERRQATARAVAKHGPNTVGMTLFLVTGWAHIQNQEKFLKKKRTFSPLASPKRERRWRGLGVSLSLLLSLPHAFILEHSALTPLCGYCWLHCRPVREQVFLTTSNFRYFFPQKNPKNF